MSTQESIELAETSVRDNLVEFVSKSTKTEVAPDLDIFASGLVSSLFAMQLVVHLEGTFGITIGGAELKLDNFRTIDAMTALVQRLRDGG